MFHRQAVVGGDAHEHDTPAGARHFGGLLDGVIGPGRFDGRVHAAPGGFFVNAGDGVFLVAVDGEGAESLGQFEPPGEFIGEENRVRAGQFGDLQDEQADGTGAQDGHAVGRAQPGQINGMKADAQGFQQSGLDVADGFRDRETAARRYEHPFAQTAVVGVVAAKAKIPAEVGMALLAEIAMEAGLGGVHRHARSRLQPLTVAIQRVRAGGVDHAGEFMPENEG